MKKTIKLLVAALGLAIISSNLNWVSAGGCAKLERGVPVVLDGRIAQPVSLDRCR